MGKRAPPAKIGPGIDFADSSDGNGTDSNNGPDSSDNGVGDYDYGGYGPADPLFNHNPHEFQEIDGQPRGDRYA